MEIKKVIVYPEYDLLAELELVRRCHRNTWQCECIEMGRMIEKIIEIL